MAVFSLCVVDSFPVFLTPRSEPILQERNSKSGHKTQVPTTFSRHFWAYFEYLFVTCINNFFPRFQSEEKKKSFSLKPKLVCERSDSKLLVSAEYF